MFSPLQKNDKALSLWLFSGCLLIFSMVIIGGITRLTHSGLSIVQWNLVMGTLPPMNEAAWQEAFNQYKLFPEYQKINTTFALHDFKLIFWWEYLHRLIGRVIGLVFLLPFLWFWLRGRISRSLMPKLLVLFGLGALQGFLGWFMVKSGLVDKPYVSHYRLAIHLFTAFVTFGFALWLALQLWYGQEGKRLQEVANPLSKLLAGFLALLGLQLVYGAFVAGLKAGYMYNSFPKMGSSWIPEAIHDLAPFYRNFLEGQAGVQFVHRSIAYLLLALAGFLLWKSRHSSLNKIQQRGFYVLLFAVLSQALLGIFTLLFFVPVPLGVLHQAGAFVLLSVGLFLLCQLQFEDKAGEILVARNGEIVKGSYSQK